MSRWAWMLKKLSRRLWVRASLIGLLGVLAAILAAVVERLVPWSIPGNIGADSVGSILNIIASSMLTVTTFSLSVATSAYNAATTNVTPRATRLLMEDGVTQNVLSTFIGAFLFSIVGIVVLKTGAYGEQGRVILFIVTIGVIVLIVVSLLRWIDHLTRLGRMAETTARVEQATWLAIDARLKTPYLGGRPLKHSEKDIPSSVVPVAAGRIGYVQHIDISALAACSEKLETEIFVGTLPGAFVSPDTALAWVAKRPDGSGGDEANDGSDDKLSPIATAFSVGQDRNFDQDPRFGLSVLCEIASRALSPGVNDPGTAIDVVGRMVRLLWRWSDGPEKNAEDEIEHLHVHVPPLTTADLFQDAFAPIARDGAGVIEVQIRLQKALHALSRTGDAEFREAALAQARLARERAEAALPLDADRKRLARGIDKAIRSGRASA
jgi:uncharacterized membrane protein